MFSNQTKTAGDSDSQNTPKSDKNKVVTTNKAEGDSTPNEPNTVPTADSPNTIKVTSSYKLDNKPTKSDSDLAVVVKAWPELPEAIRSAIVGIVRASRGEHSG